MLRAGLDINARDFEGHTPLYKLLNGPYPGTDEEYSPVWSANMHRFASGRKAMLRFLENAGGTH
jgi:hypothetical protein